MADPFESALWAAVGGEKLLPATLKTADASQTSTATSSSDCGYNVGCYASQFSGWLKSELGNGLLLVLGLLLVIGGLFIVGRGAGEVISK